MIGILGGSFDPIHYGHLHIAQSVYQQLHLSEVRFIPCKNPVLKKKTYANQEQRLAMLQLALQPYSYFSIDERELHRATPSYMLDTLISLRQEFNDRSLGLILGEDNLANLNHWYEWSSLIRYAHLLVVPRPDQIKAYAYDADICAFVEKYQTNNFCLLKQEPAGSLFMTHVKPLSISATAIRKQIASGAEPTGLLPPLVLNYILKKKLYL